MIPIDGEPFQRLMAVPDASDLCTVLDVSALDEQECMALVQESSARPFDLEHDLPIRVWILREAVDSHIVVLVMHHAPRHVIAGLMLLASASVYVPGVVWLKIATGASWGAALSMGVVPFIVGDILKSLVATGLLPARGRLH